ncbi:MAG: aminotransferase class IV [Pseudomonadota bacterium]
MTYWLNGDFKEDTIAVDITDRGFLLGDGLFETLLVIDGASVFLSQHLQRLRDGLSALGFHAPLGGLNVGQIINKLAVDNNVAEGEASARITVTRGAGARGLDYRDNQVATILITLGAYAPKQTEQPSRLIIARQRRCEQSLSARWKTLNYLDNTVARNEALKAGADDAVMLNGAGRVACASAANVFAIHDGAVMTPPISEGALPGIVRARLLCCARAGGVQITVAPVTVETLSRSALFLTNSLIGLRAAYFRTGHDAQAQEILQSLQSCYAEMIVESLKKQDPS